MNEVVKTNIKTRLECAMEKEGLKPTETARIFGIHPNYVSMIKNPNTWVKCPQSAWESVLTWVNSGQGLLEWSEKHGKVLPEKPEKSEIPKPLVTVKPEALERRKEELAVRNQKPKRATRGELIDMLIAEKELLKCKVDAIDVLLKHYIS